MRPIIPASPVYTGTKSITLPDGQQFFADKLVNISQSSNVLTLNLSGLSTPVTYTAANIAAAFLVKKDVINATASTDSRQIEIVEQAGSSDVVISSVTPNPIAAAGGEVLTLTGTGLRGSAAQVEVWLIFPDSSTSQCLVDFADSQTVITNPTPTTGFPVGSADVSLFLNGVFAASYTVTVA